MLDIFLLQLLDFSRVEHHCAAGGLGTEVTTASLLIVGIGDEECLSAGKLVV